jgi:membrane-associated phospholipid phosphatase
MNNERWREMLIWGGACVVVCLSFYLISNEIASRISVHYRMYAEAEKSIPLIPWMIYIYASFHLLLALNFFIIKDPKVIKAFTISLMCSSFVAVIVFLVFPGELGFSRTENIAGYEPMFNLLHQIDHPFNLYPSLHITFSVLTAFVMVDQTKSKLFHGILLTWIVLICCSVVLVHQHHVFDVITGLLLAYGVIKLIYRRMIPGD